jgi:uncharacterized protein YgiM (DUF1202 family)
MKDQNVDDNWQLREEGAPDDKWVLHESEQTLDDPWELRSAPADDLGGWQPVEYVKPRRPLAAWLLPMVISAALLVVIGYTGFRVLPGFLGLEQEEPTPTLQAVAAETVAPAEEATATTPPETSPTPTVTPSAPTATQPPPPSSNVVMQQFAKVINPLGVNARVAPNTDATVIRILEFDESLWVFSTQGEWLELFVAEAPVVEDQPLLGAVGFAAAEFFEIETREVTVDLQQQVLAYAGKLPTPTPVAPTPAAGTGVTETVAPTGTAPTGVTVTITAAAGVNVRRDPDATVENIIRLVENGTVLPALARTADNAWVQVQLPDGVTGWIAAEFVTPSADLSTLPTPETAAAPSPTVPAVSAGGVVTSGVEVAAPYTNVVPQGTPAIIVTVVDGVNARSAPVLDANVEAIVPQGAVLPATGRSSDSQWVQVELPTGVLAWIFRDTVTATPEVGALPAVDGGAPTPTPTGEPVVLLPTPTPSPEPTATQAPVTAVVRSFVLPVYTEASNTSDIILRAPRGTDFVVVGQTAAGDWLQVETGAGVGWVVAGNVTVTGDLTTVPVVE